MVLCPLIIPPGGENQRTHDLRTKVAEDLSDPKFAVESIYELYFDPRTRLEAVLSSCS